MSDSLFTELKRRNVVKVGVAYLVLAWVVIQVTDSAVPALHLPEWVNSLVFYLGAIGFPFALFFAWAFEITPDGVKRESDIAPEDSITAHTGRKLDFTIIGLLAIGLGYFIYESRFSTESETTDKSVTTTEPGSTLEPGTKVEQQSNNSSIAVLPFVNMSVDESQGYFSDGITEEILNALVAVNGLEVASRTSSFQFKGRDLGIPHIAEQLKVRYVVEGSVRKAGKTIRITAQLIDASNDRHLWSDTYDRPLSIDNIFVIQDEISRSIVEALRDELGIDQITNAKLSKTTDDLSAYELFLQSRPLFQSRTKLDVAHNLLTQAVEQDPYTFFWCSHRL